MAPSLAESRTASPDGPVDEFALRRGAEFDTDDPVTAADVKSSFGRDRGAAASIPRQRVASVEIVDPQRVRVRPRQPRPDVMTFHGCPRRAPAGSCPGNNVEKVGLGAGRAYSGPSEDLRRNGT